MICRADMPPASRGGCARSAFPPCSSEPRPVSIPEELALVGNDNEATLIVESLPGSRRSTTIRPLWRGPDQDPVSQIRRC